MVALLQPNITSETVAPLQQTVSGSCSFHLCQWEKRGRWDILLNWVVMNPPSPWGQWRLFGKPGLLLLYNNEATHSQPATEKGEETQICWCTGNETRLSYKPCHQRLKKGMPWSTLSPSCLNWNGPIPHKFKTVTIYPVWRRALDYPYN